MLIDTKQIISMTQLRENLTDILAIVNKGKELMIADRGKIKAKLSPVKKTKQSQDKVDKFMKEIRALGKKISAKNPNFDSVKALREVRREN